MPEIVTTIADLRTRIGEWRGGRARVGLVPTMGALHEGHLSLLSLTGCEKNVVSIFVNPIQFAPHEDFDVYPRSLESDVAKLRDADLVFAPSAKEIYPAGFATSVSVKGPALGLESEFRPYFFDGVATVVAKLLTATAPDAAVFGEKDYQQLLVVRRLVSDLGLAVTIIGAPVVRATDGLALSSRNTYLGEGERKIAGELNRVLRDVIGRVRGGAAIAETEAEGRAALLAAGFASVDYLVLRDAVTLSPIGNLARPARVLAAATVGRTRLIDNMPV